MLQEVMILVGPILAVAIVVSLVVNIIQILTSLQDITVSTVSRLLATGARSVPHDAVDVASSGRSTRWASSPTFMGTCNDPDSPTYDHQRAADHWRAPYRAHAFRALLRQRRDSHPGEGGLVLAMTLLLFPTVGHDIGTYPPGPMADSDGLHGVHDRRGHGHRNQRRLRGRPDGGTGARRSDGLLPGEHPRSADPGRYHGDLRSSTRASSCFCFCAWMFTTGF